MRFNCTVTRNGIRFYQLPNGYWTWVGTNAIFGTLENAIARVENAKNS